MPLSPTRALPPDVAAKALMLRALEALTAGGLDGTWRIDLVSQHGHLQRPRQTTVGEGWGFQPAARTTPPPSSPSSAPSASMATR